MDENGVMRGEPKREGGGRSFAALLLAALVGASGCAWVEPDPGAAELATAIEPALVEDCRRVGAATSRTRARVLLVRRNEEKVEKELAILARNDAPERGADTVVPDGPVRVEGANAIRRFALYDCSAVAR